MVLSDVLTAKTFDEIGNAIRHARFGEYTRLRLMYYSSQDAFEKRSTLDSFAQTSNAAVPARKRQYSKFETPSGDDTLHTDFSEFDNESGYNELLQPDAEVIKQFFINFVSERQELLDRCFDSIIPCASISFDATFHIQKRIKVHTTSGKFVSVNEDARIIFLNGTGEILYHAAGKEDSAAINKALETIRRRCDTLGTPYPLYFTCDDAKAWENQIQRVFPRARVLQDIKHLINRCIELVGTAKDGAAAFSEDFHKAFTAASDIPVRSRTGKDYKISAPLETADIIIKRADAVIDRYRKLFPTLFTEEFFGCWQTQKWQIEKYVADPLLNGTELCN
jgi:hypothetical protein